MQLGQNISRLELSRYPPLEPGISEINECRQIIGEARFRTPMLRISVSVFFLFALPATGGYSQEKSLAHRELDPERSAAVPNRAEASEIRTPVLAPAPKDAEFTISKQVDEVNLILSVTDAKERFV